MTCSIDGCGKPRFCRGWCAAHWTRWRRHGDPLGGNATPGLAEKYLREVVMAYDGDECLIWPFRKRRWYPTVVADGKCHVASRLVCTLAHGEPPTPHHQAAHSCGRGREGCVTKRHLRWATPLENSADMVTHGTIQVGGRNPSAKLTEAEVRAIREQAATETYSIVATRYGVSKAIIGAILRREKWAHVL